MSVSLETDPLSWGYPEGQDIPSRASAEVQINSSSKLHSWAREPTGATVSSSLEFAPPCLRGFQTLLTKHHDDHPARSRLICSRDLQFNRKRSIIPPLTLVQQPQKQTPVKTLPIALELGALATLCWPTTLKPSAHILLKQTHKSNFARGSFSGMLLLGCQLKRGTWENG